MGNIKRLCIYLKDIMRITGRCERYGRKLLTEVREYFGKQTHQFITTEEFAEYSGIKEEDIKHYLE
ncbi:hypothetical protein ES674_06795 [Bizionia myxarmorum]|uniref:Uncharacterized protein n=1 Tax=Bizionia myxarmorum TaxID=291186 RepID=A0A5D0RFB2_9FLAO|nr:hypothetical protein ES674_06795 [Bizionia myxarmorum]